MDELTIDSIRLAGALSVMAATAELRIAPSESLAVAGLARMFIESEMTREWAITLFAYSLICLARNEAATEANT